MPKICYVEKAFAAESLAKIATANTIIEEYAASGFDLTLRQLYGGQDVVVLHFGDHDPSGIDMTRDIEDRLRLFCGEDVSLDVERIALTMAQVRRYNPPPNPAKVTDSRFAAYLRAHGKESWELDALEPRALSDLVRDKVAAHLDPKLWKKAHKRQEEERSKIAAAVEAM